MGLMCKCAQFVAPWSLNLWTTSKIPQGSFVVHKFVEEVSKLVGHGQGDKRIEVRTRWPPLKPTAHLLLPRHLLSLLSTLVELKKCRETGHLPPLPVAHPPQARRSHRSCRSLPACLACLYACLHVPTPYSPTIQHCQRPLAIVEVTEAQLATICGFPKFESPSRGIKAYN